MTEAAVPALHPSLYLDEDVVALEQERIFERTWQLAGHVAHLKEAGSYITAQAGDQPVLVIRDDEGVIRAYRNVCRHRGSRLLSGSGQCKKAIRCRYHGWTYRLDGSLIGVPEGRSYPGGVDKAELGLFPVRCETMCGLVFVNLDPHADSLADQLGDLPQRLERYRIEELQPFDPWFGKQPVNWKVVADNYLEGYHVPIGHPGLMRLLDYQRYDAEVHDSYVWFECPFRKEPSGNRLERLYQRVATTMPGLTEEDREVWRYIYIWPNTTIDLYPDQVMTWQIVPGGTDSERDIAWSYRHPSAGPRTRLAHWANRRFNVKVAEEDVDLVKNVQAGIRTRGYECGPLSRREAGVAWFAERIRAELGDHSVA